MALMANFVHAYASIWPKAQEVLSTMPSEKKALTKFWKTLVLCCEPVKRNVGDPMGPSMDVGGVVPLVLFQ